MSSSLIDDVVMVFSIPPIAVVLLVGLDISQVELVGYRGWRFEGQPVRRVPE